MSETTTNQYQKKPDYFPSAEDCLQSERQKVNTNPRYKFFNQTHFTAGDIDQFEQHRDASNGRICIPEIDMSQNRFSAEDLLGEIDWEKYRDLDAMSVTNTFNYLFNKFKKGIFIKIKNGSLRVFLPFSKKNFTNEWSRRIHIDPKYGNLLGFIRYTQTMEGRRFFPNRVNKFIDSWYSNNCLVRYEFPIGEGDSNNPNMSDMFAVLCAERKLPDMEFFVNRRDFPLLKTDGTEPYSQMYDTNSMKLLSHNYDTYCPILSMVTAKNFADLPIPTGDDWARVCRREGKYFPKTCTRDFEVTPVPWENRKPMAVFRGGSTGCGVTIETNPRLKLAFLSSTKPTDENGQLLLDAGITNWNLRPRKLKGQKYLQTIDIKKLPFGLVERLSPQEQAEYKYVVDVDGHVSAYRLSFELESGACVLLAASKYKLWFAKLIKPYEHFVPIKSDLSDLLDKIKWCKRHDAKCKRIALNAQEFARTYLSKEGILDYLQRLLFAVKRVNGVYLYNSVSLIDLQYKNEYDMTHGVARFVPPSSKTLNDLSLIPQQHRSYGLLQGVEWIVNKVLEESSFTEVATRKRKIFDNGISSIGEYELAGYSLVRKSSKIPSRKTEMVHEIFVTTKVTNELLKQIPNFVYVFGAYWNDSGMHMILEHVQGETFTQYIRGPNFNIEDFSLILIQLALALHVAQRTCGLVHHDLTPWNVIIQRLPEPVKFDYIIDHETVYTVTTQLVPIIIDMGRSHVIYKNNHYGMINMFQMSTIQDIILILTTSIYEVAVKDNISPKAVNILIRIANFLSGTKYRQKPFVATGKNGLGDIRFFFRKAKRYTELISGNKFDLENKTPLDFVEYMLKNIRFPVQRTNRLNNYMSHGNARQVFDYAFCSTDQERALTFASVFHRVKDCDIPEPSNLLLAYYTAQSLEANLTSVYNIMISFLQATGIESDRYVRKYKRIMKRIRKRFAVESKEAPIEYTLEKVPPIVYHAHTFLFPEQIYKMIEMTKDTIVPVDLTPYKEIIEQMFLYSSASTYALTPEIRSYYTKNFSQLLQGNTVRIKTGIADLVTLRNTASLLYSADSRHIAQKLSEEKGDCAVAQKNYEQYDRILQLLK
uniref:Protein kinase domain-containing protein n=1 Tax=viral metagenome TaxID=1070528 RepID=A0A6C0EPT5_9ZZZZ